MCGIEVCREKDEKTGNEIVYIAQEKNVNGEYRTITAIPLKFVKK